MQNFEGKLLLEPWLSPGQASEAIESVPAIAQLFESALKQAVLLEGFAV